MDATSERPIDRLLGLMRVLRSEDGCPWDREQTLSSLKTYLVEEAYEEIEAIDAGDYDRIREELGDLLLQVVFQARICEEEGRFGFEDVARTIADKLVRRHPHVFGDAAVSGAEDVVRNWEAIKRGEAGDGPRRSVLDGVPRSLPALEKAAKVQGRAARAGFDWPDPSGVLDKVGEEAGELRRALGAGEPGPVEEEFGDLLFTLVNLARFLGLNGEEALNRATAKFARRFRAVEERARASGVEVDACSPERLDALWEDAKRDGA